MKIGYKIKFNTSNCFTSNILDISKKELKKAYTIKSLNINIDFSMSKGDFKKFIKRTNKIIKKVNKSNVQLTFYIYNYNEKNHDFMKVIEAICITNIIKRYNFIYEEVYYFLENEFIKKNLCGFKNDKCKEKINTISNVGCCRHYKNKVIGPLGLKNKLVVCEYLKNKKCSARCISCKLYTCDYLKNKGIKFRIKDILLLDIFFNPIQKYILKYSVFTPKKKIIKKLLKTSLE